MGLAGLRQNANPDFAQLATALTFTGSNVLIEHPLINIENLDMCAKNYGFYNYADWSNATEYAEDTSQEMVRVKYNNVFYRSKVDENEDNQPDTSPDFWEPLNLLSLYLEDVFGAAAVEVVNQVFNRKKEGGQTKTLIKNVRLFESPGNLNDRVVNDGSLVGVEILMKYNHNIIGIIERIGLQLTEQQTDTDKLNLYLYHSSMVEPIATVEVNHTKQISFQWHTANTFQLNYNDPNHEPGGIYYLMYDQNDLIGQAVKKNTNFTKPCASCGQSQENVNFGLRSKYFSIRAAKVSAINRNQDDDLELWDISKTEFPEGNNFGLNLELTVRCDVTNFIVQQKDVFAFAFRDMVIFKLLNILANSTRQNQAQTKVDLLARNELQAKYVGGLDFLATLNKQLDAVNFEFSDLDETCMPCKTDYGLSYGVASLSK